MANDLPSIDDLLKDNKNSQAPEVASEKTKEQLEKKIEEIGLKDIERRTEAEANRLGLKYISLEGFPIGQDTLSIINEDTARELKTVAIYKTQKELRIATVNPEDPKVQQLAKDLEEKYYTFVDTYLVSEHSLNKAFKLYANIPKARKVIQGIEITEEMIKEFSKGISTYKDLQEKIKNISVTDIVAAIFAGGLQARVSDIHIEAEEEDIKVRYRIDGILHDAASIDKSMWPKLISRIKLLAELKLNVEDRPQDGRFTIFMTDDKIDVRVSVLPTAFGESVVIRLLRSATAGFAFDDLGITGAAFEQLETEIKRPNGMIITTGPTGSGKTTTLYAILNKLNVPGTKIITIEDPVEYELTGINQSQIDSDKGYSFSNGLRSIVRQDPDIIMVGEIRDLETAEIAIQASLTGHLVLSTIHTNSAAGTIPRLLSMGAKGFLLSPAINAMIGQRLVRRVCPECKEETTLDPKQRVRVEEALQALPDENKKAINFDHLVFYKGGGCEQCQGLGYRGRIGVYEIMIMTPEMEKLILKGEISETEIEDLAIKNGMITMVQDGLLKALQGITTVKEVFRVAE